MDKKQANAALFTAVVESAYNVQAALDAGANVNARDHLKRTPLHHAAIRVHPFTAKLLIDNGADVNAKSANGETPLHEAIRLGEAAIVELLIESGADVKQKLLKD